MTLTLEQEVSTFEATTYREQLSVLWGVPLDDLALELSGGSVVILVGIAARLTTDVATFNASLNAISDAQLSAAFGVNVTRTSTGLGLVNVTSAEVVQEQCELHQA